MTYNHDKNNIAFKQKLVKNSGYQYPPYSDLDTKQKIDHIRVYDHYLDVNKYDVGHQIYHNPNAPTRFYPTMAQVKMTEDKYGVKCDKTRSLIKSDKWQGYELDNKKVLTYKNAIKDFSFAPRPLPLCGVEGDFRYMCWRMEINGVWQFDNDRFVKYMEMHCFDLKADKVDSFFDNWEFNYDKFNKNCVWANNLDSKKRGFLNPYACELKNVNNNMPSSSSFNNFKSKDIRCNPPAIMSSSSKSFKKKSNIEKHSTECSAKKSKSDNEKFDIDTFMEKYSELKVETSQTIIELKADIKEVSDENTQLKKDFDRMKERKEFYKEEAAASKSKIDDLEEKLAIAKEKAKFEREQNKKMTAMMDAMRGLSLVCIDNYGTKSANQNDDFQIYGKAKEDGRVYFAMKSEKFEDYHNATSHDSNFISCRLPATKIQKNNNNNSNK